MTLTAWNPSPAARQLTMVSQLLQQSAPAFPAQMPAPMAMPAGDRFALATPGALFRGLMPAIDKAFGFGAASPAQQLAELGRKYGVANTKGDLNKYQSDVIKTIITVKARQYGIPEQVALGISGNESGWKMWKNVASGELIQGRNVRDGQLKSTDWGAMQINDKAHARAFPRAKQDLEYNIDYALKFLARQRESIKGDLGHGFGDWDRTIASYNLGHNPTSQRDYQIAARYVGHVNNRADSLFA